MRCHPTVYCGLQSYVEIHCTKHEKMVADQTRKILWILSEIILILEIKKATPDMSQSTAYSYMHICMPSFHFTLSLSSLIKGWLHLQILSSSFVDIKPFVCLLCNATFTRQHSLNYHMLIHNGTTRFKCPDCGRAFRHPSHYKVCWDSLLVCHWYINFQCSMINLPGWCDSRLTEIHKD